jgi:hypothetical protein
MAGTSRVNRQVHAPFSSAKCGGYEEFCSLPVSPAIVDVKRSRPYCIRLTSAYDDHAEDFSVRAKVIAGIRRAECPKATKTMLRTCTFTPPTPTQPLPPRTTEAMTRLR